MYSYIKGELVDLTEDYIIVEVMGIGYEIMNDNPFRFQPFLNQLVKIYTYLHVREDAQILYGFKEEEEKEMFKKLLNVSGIGPKHAMNIVGQTTVHDFALAIEKEDDQFLTQFPGVGKKTARQMILDLKGKVNEWMNHSTNQTVDEYQSTSESGTSHYEEAIEALKALGYSSKEINKVSVQLKTLEATSTDDIVKKGLQLLMR
ncbi:Holliday junction branch migration protein RuvA [Piscibacillus halophilus]|uniref:Holliday junction branch migration complex subunit RuvA n=1 Tax=Piscibacillus halophilus TaxID=571933 RepID=A0A1H9BVZ8_9BACI|nr:Holliday junction branch migration protein RuvA [Piscibacillus halophilus]SEP93112.1 Holliday junction DNA helicase subunit RuvA [Piscibacillus halophilus]